MDSKPIIGTFFSATIHEANQLAFAIAAHLVLIKLDRDPVLDSSDSLSCDEVQSRHYAQHGVWYVVGLYGPGDYDHARPVNQNG